MTLMILHARDAGTDPRRQRQIRDLSQAQLPVGYAALCALCHKMLLKVRPPRLGPRARPHLTPASR